MAIKLVAVDLDGTLLDTDSRVNAHTREAVAQAQKAGIQVAIATGRMTAECREIFEQVPEIEYAVTSTSGRVLNIRTGQTIGGYLLEPERTRKLYHLLEGYDNIIDLLAGGCARYDRARMEAIRPRLPEGIEAFMEHFYVPWDDLGGFIDTWDEPTEKLFSVYPDRAERDAALARLQQEDCFVTCSSETNLEVTASDKGAGLRLLTQYLGLRKDEVMAIGDSSNDALLLQASGWPVAMGNATPDILALCSIHAPSNADDGVAVILEKLVRGEL